jgi:D-alanine transaminase
LRYFLDNARINNPLMPRIAYVNGRYLPHHAARVHIEDRALQFSDGVYEVIAIRNGRLMDAPPHMQRLARSLHELEIAAPMQARAMHVVFGEVVRRNHVLDGILYLQISRGAAPREHRFPPPGTPPGFVVTVQRQDLRLFEERARQGVKVATSRDLRWKRRDIKSVSLLGNVLAKQAAVSQGAYEAWLVDDDGVITEGSSTNAWIVSADNEIITRPAGEDILSGITRDVLLKIALRRNLTLVERGFSHAEALAAKEAFLTSTTALALAVTQIDGQPIGNGRPGPIVAQLRSALMARWQVQMTK